MYFDFRNRGVYNLKDIRYYNWMIACQKSGVIRTTKFFYHYHKKGRFVDLPGDSMKFANQIDKIISVLNRKYGENWDFFLYHVGNGRFAIKLLIHYPEVKISNRLDKTHNIKDLFVKLNLGTVNDSDIITFIGSIDGFRTTYSYNEAYSMYTHSHLGRKDIFSSPYQCLADSNFCTGEGPLVDAFDELYDSSYDGDEIEDIRFESFFYLLDSYVEWESLEGGPYIHFSEIKGVNFGYRIYPTTPNIVRSTNAILNYYRKNKQKFKKLTFVLNNGSLVLSDNGVREIEKVFMDLVKEGKVDADIPNIVGVLNADGSHIISTNNTGIKTREELDSLFKSSYGYTSFAFRDKEIKPYIESSLETINKEELRVAPEVLNHIKKEINQIIKNGKIKKAFDEKYTEAIN